VEPLNFLAIDFETANQYRDSACSIGLVRVRGGIITDKVVKLIKPPQTWFIFTSIHGLAWDDVKNAPDFGLLWPEIEPLFNGVDFLAAHNATFDRSVLSACCEKYGISMPQTRFLCTMHLARQKWNIHPTKLSNVCEKLGITLNHHEALSDAHACAQIILRACEEESRQQSFLDTSA